MKIAIASGKGGTGKTTLATCLAVTAATHGRSTTYVDCDVEAPNGHLLLQPSIEQRQPVTRLVPEIDLARCDRCGVCERVCQFGAILCFEQGVQVQPNLCKSCGACITACPQQAMEEIPRHVGEVFIGRSGPVGYLRGELDVGQPRSIPVIEAARHMGAAPTDLTVLDAPPGASCPMVTAVRGADLILLVADATPFGLADLNIAVQTVRSLNMPVAVVINRSDLGDRQVYEFCETHGLPVFAEIPYSHGVAQAYAEGDLARLLGELDTPLAALLDRVTVEQARRAS